jgi:hypothetical protein
MQGSESTAASNQPSMLGYLWGKVKTWLIASTILGLVSMNVLTLLSEAVHDVLFGGVKAVLATVAQEEVLSRLLRNSPTVKRKSDVATATRVLSEEKAAISASKKALELKHAELARVSAVRSGVAKKMSKRLATRAVVNATRNSTSIFAESIPYIGVAVVLGVTALDLRDTCETLKDMNEVNAAFDLEPEDQTKVCGIHVPTKAEVLVKVKSEAHATYKAAMEALNMDGAKVE